MTSSANKSRDWQMEKDEIYDYETHQPDYWAGNQPHGDVRNSPDPASTPYEADIGRPRTSHGRQKSGLAQQDDDHKPHKHTEEERKTFDTPFPKRSPNSSPKSSPRPYDQAHGEPHSSLGYYQDQEEDEDEEEEDFEDEPPEYDVTERIRQLNEELAKDPTPGLEDDDIRRHSIKFKDDPVTLVVPPPEFDESEDELGFKKSNAEEKAPENDSRMAKEKTPAVDSNSNQFKPESNQHRPPEEDADQVSDEEIGGPSTVKSMKPVEKSAVHTKSSDGKTEDSDEDDDYQSDSNGNQSADDKSKALNNSSHPKKEDKILLERNGKFELVNINDLSVEEREMYVNESKSASGASSSIGSKDSYSRHSHQPHPPRDNKQDQPHQGQRRVQSANHYKRRMPDDFSYISPYGLTEEQKRQLEHQKKSKEKKDKKEMEKKEQEEEMKKKDSESAFQSWLDYKKKQAGKEKKHQKEEKENQEKHKQDQEERDQKYRDETLKHWLKRKSEEKEQERRLSAAKEQEEMEKLPTVQERQRAFKQWLRAKDQAKKQEREALKIQAKLNRLKARQARKAQQLAKTITFSQGYSYTDYYGYRF